MRVLLLPGFSEETKDEADLYCKALTKAGFVCETHRWLHWYRPEEGWDNRREIAAIERKIEAYGGEHFVFLAKSVGTYIACQILVGHPELLDQVSHVLLLGIPLKDTKHVEAGVYPAALTRYKGPITVIQNADDPFARATQIDSLLTGSKARLLVEESDSHHYPYADELVRILQPAHAGA